jgi:CRP/FNR family transcriptional regulator
MDLTAFPFYHSLDQEAVEFLQSNLLPVELPKGSLLFYQGDICKHILMPTSGSVRLYLQAEGIEALTLYSLQPGEQCIVNTASGISCTPAIASAEVTEDITGYLLDIESAKELARLSQEYQSYIFSLYTLRMESLAALIRDIKFKRLDQRVMEWLQSQEQQPVRITHEKIATDLGSSRVVVSRILKSMEHDGLIRLKRGEIELLS